MRIRRLKVGDGPGKLEMTVRYPGQTSILDVQVNILARAIFAGFLISPLSPTN